MKHIGIVSVSGPGAALAFQIITEVSIRESFHPMITMNHLSYQDYLNAINSNDWDFVASLIENSLKILKSAGAAFAIIPANTVHFAIDKIMANAQLPIINILDCVSEEIYKQGFKKVAVLGTKFTMNNKLYHPYLKKYDIAEKFINEGLTNDIHNLIMNEIIPGLINQSSISKISEKLKIIDCDCFVLACTELSIVFNENILLKHCIDTTKTLSNAAFKEATINHL